jgi:two-component system cell cycle response regulator
MIDVDHFKLVNDEYGHAAGDKALRAIADTLRANTRAFDSLARYGGEEFVVVMPGTEAEDASLAAERLRAAVEALPFALGSNPNVRLTISIGVACCQDTPVTPEALLHAADEALYTAKHGGRNRVVVAAPLAGAVAT